MEKSMGSAVALMFLLGLAGSGLAAEAPLAVSPGDPSKAALISGPCPTFSWGEVEGARSYELVVYRLADEGETATPVLRQSFGGSVGSWTPSLERCLERGGRYAWSVGAGGEWSGPSLFEVAGSPSIDEVEKAMALLKAYMEDRMDSPNTVSGVSGPPEDSQSPKTAGPTGGVEARALKNETVGAAAALSAPALGAPSLTLNGGNLHLLGASNVFKDGKVLLWSGFYNLGIGTKALESATSGLGNTAVGNYALRSLSSGGGNTAVGHAALALSVGASGNTAVGNSAMVNTTSGERNTAVGAGSLQNNLSSSDNVAVGNSALSYNEAGSWNTATGRNALRKNTTDFNTANGFEALRDTTTGNRNTAVGALALSKNVGGVQNTAVGVDALRDTTAGSNNTAIGFQAGLDLTGGGSNVFINSRGAGGFETNTLRIGRATGFGVHELYQVFIQGIYGVTTAGTNHPVYVNSYGKLGKATSSRRFKKEIRDQGPLSSRLLGLRPVTFRFEPEATDGPQPLEFGLIAEEVAQVFPELVDYDKQGRPESVKYHLLSSLLLNELQKQDRRIDLVERKNSSARAATLALLLIAVVAVTAVRSRPG